MRLWGYEVRGQLSQVLTFLSLFVFNTINSKRHAYLSTRQSFNRYLLAQACEHFGGSPLWCARLSETFCHIGISL